MLKSFRAHGLWAERFTDRVYGIGASVASPPDLIAVGPKHVFLCELKAVKGKSLEMASIPMSRLAEHQCIDLMEFDRTDIGHAYVLVMFYEGEKALKRTAFFIPLNYWMAYNMRYDRKSIRLQHLRQDIPHLECKWAGRSSEVGPWLLPGAFK
jgi:penicillin-binding protein-related factor A (putative recombinase)